MCNSVTKMTPVGERQKGKTVPDIVGNQMGSVQVIQIMQQQECASSLTTVLCISSLYTHCAVQISLNKGDIFDMTCGKSGSTTANNTRNTFILHFFHGLFYLFTFS